MQEALETAGLNFNGCKKEAARLCMDKFKTSEIVNSLNIKGLRGCRKIKISKSDLIKKDIDALYLEIQKEIGNDKIIIKPNSDGCSTGVVIIENKNHLKKYIELIKNGENIIPPNTFYDQKEPISLPDSKDYEILFEEYIKTDEIAREGTRLVYKKKTGYHEMTVGVLEKGGAYESLFPSITIAESGVLSVEEKFQGGTGINITPPPENIISKDFLKKIMKDVEAVAKAAGVRDYCRIDIFAREDNEEVIIIEVNTLPGLSPSTVLFQQAAKADMTPLALLEKIID
jgi:D-alanine-D-alanine ligase-like ATP-grasp enzyme